MIKICHQVKNRTNCPWIFIFCKIPRKSTEMSKFCDKGKIPWLGSKFRGLQKTVSPINNNVFSSRQLSVAMNVGFNNLLSLSLLQAGLDPSGEEFSVSTRLCSPRPSSRPASPPCCTSRRRSTFFFVFPYSVVHVRLPPRFSWHNPLLLGVVHAQTISTWPPILCP